MPEWSTACPDWAERLRSGRSIIPPPIFPEEAESGLAVMRELRIVDAPGSPKMADACGQWVFDLAASIFGAYDAESGRRLITEWFVMLPKKNFKSGLAAAIMLTCLVRNWRQSAEFTILAPTVEVANNSFGPARDMVMFEDEDEPNELADLIHVQTHIKTLTHREKKAQLKVVAADENTAAGKKSVGTLVEELWLFGKQAGAKEMLREALGGLASRPEGFVIWLTTQSDEPPAGVFKEKLEYARKVRDGKISDPQFLPIIFEHPPEMVAAGEHRSLEALPMVNPNLGYSVDRAFLAREHRKATEEGEESLRGFLAKHGNVQVTMALAGDRWAGADYWLQQARPGLTLEELLARCEVATVGLDGGGLYDLYGVCVLGRERGTGHWLSWQRAWLQRDQLDKRPADASKLRDFEREGTLVLVDSVRDDIQQVAELVAQVNASGLLAREGEVPSIAVDQLGLGDTLSKLEEVGIEPGQIIGIPQGYRLMTAIQTVDRRLKGRELWHPGSALMAWCAGNARTRLRGNALIVEKEQSGRGKIDPLMALFNAAALMALNPAPASDIDAFLSSPVIA